MLSPPSPPPKPENELSTLRGLPGPCYSSDDSSSSNSASASPKGRHHELIPPSEKNDSSADDDSSHVAWPIPPLLGADSPHYPRFSVGRTPSNSNCSSLECSTIDVSFYSDDSKEEEEREEKKDQDPNQEKKVGCCCSRFWSVTSLTIGLFLFGTLFTSVVFWSIGYFITRIGLSSLAVQAQASRLLAVRDSLENMLADAPIALNTLEHVFRWEDGQNGTRLYNVSMNGEFVNGDRQRTVLFRIARYLPNAHVLYVGMETGEFVGLGQLPRMNGDALDLGDFHFTYASNGTCHFVVLTEKDGIPATPGLSVSIPFDPRVRGWFIQGRQMLEGNTSWSVTFLSKTPVPALSMVLIRPLYLFQEDLHSSAPPLLGVLGCHLFLDGINDYLRSLVVSGEVMYLVQSSGDLLATSVGLVGKQVSENVWQKISPLEHSNSVVRTTAEILNEKFPSSGTHALAWQTTDETLQVKDPLTSTAYLVDVLEYTDSYGLHVFIVLANPRRNIFQEADLARYVSIGLGAGFFVVSLMVSSFFAYNLTTPLRRVTQLMRRIAMLDFPRLLRNRRSLWCGRTMNALSLYEFKQMNESIECMSQGLRKFARFLPRDVVATLVSKRLSLEMKHEIMTVIFVDIERFTSISEVVSSETLVGFLTEFFDLTTSSIKENEGTIDKYIGDCCMGFFNAPNRVKDHPSKAVRAANEIVSIIAARNAEIRHSCTPTTSTGPCMGNRIPFNVRCGINTGPSLVGLIGGRERYSYTVMGDTVNTASRLESFNRRYGTRIMIGPRTAESAKKEFLCQYVDTVCLRGKLEPIAVHAVIGRLEGCTKKQQEDCDRFGLIQKLFAVDSFATLAEECAKGGFETEVGEVAAKLLLDRVDEMQNGQKWLCV